MTSQNWLALSRVRPVYELSREDGSPIQTAEARRHQDGVDANRLPPQAAISLSRAIKAKALRPSMPDSTKMIRADRDGR